MYVCMYVLTHFTSSFCAHECIYVHICRSFDHQALSFKLQDKRFYSAKNLVNDIKGGNNEMEQYLLQTAPGISDIVEPSLQELLADMNPNLSLEYDSADQGALKDVYRAVCHAMECSGANPILHHAFIFRVHHLHDHTCVYKSV